MLPEDYVLARETKADSLTEAEKEFIERVVRSSKNQWKGWRTRLGIQAGTKGGQTHRGKQCKRKAAAAGHWQCLGDWAP